MMAFAAVSKMKRQWAKSLGLFLALTLTLWASASWALGSNGSSLFGGQGNEFLPVDEALPFSFTTDADSVVLSWDITPGHYLYRERVSITAKDSNVALGEPVFSAPGTVTEDEFFGKTTVFFDPIEARVPVSLPAGTREAELQVTYQGCAKAGLCYPPQTRDVLFYQGSGGSGSQAASAAGFSGGQSVPVDTETATGLAGFLAQQSTLVIAGVFLLLGLGLTFTPCVLPMVPIISSLVSGRNTRTTGHALLLSGSYVLGMALTYAAAGVLILWQNAEKAKARHNGEEVDDDYPDFVLSVAKNRFRPFQGTVGLYQHNEARLLCNSRARQYKPIIMEDACQSDASSTGGSASVESLATFPTRKTPETTSGIEPTTTRTSMASPF